MDRATLARLAAELAAARDLSLALEATVGGLASGADRAALVELQALDRLTQTLGALAGFTAALAAGASAAEAAALMPLGAIAARLVGANPPEPGGDELFEGGEAGH